MTLRDAIEGELSYFRAEAESLMSDTLAFGTMVRGGQGDETGLEEPTFVAAFTTPGKVTGGSRGNDQAVRMVTIGGTERPVIAGGVHIPADRRETVPNGMYAKVTALGPSSPAHLLNRVYRVEGESTKSHQTARRFDVVELP